MSKKFWMFFFQYSGLIILFQEIKDARKIYNDTGFCSVLVGNVIKRSFLVEVAPDSEY